MANSTDPFPSLQKNSNNKDTAKKISTKQYLRSRNYYSGKINWQRGLMRFGFVTIATFFCAAVLYAYLKYSISGNEMDLSKLANPVFCIGLLVLVIWNWFIIAHTLVLVFLRGVSYFAEMENFLKLLLLLANIGFLILLYADFSGFEEDITSESTLESIVNDMPDDEFERFLALPVFAGIGYAVSFFSKMNFGFITAFVIAEFVIGTAVIFILYLAVQFMSKGFGGKTSSS